ncbi:MAG: transcription termination/antitermination protein NusA, partial [Nitrospinae bacterium]|nr:transcription termination/antitermination protein NusA [Nitrospinota bacterium]
MSTELINALKMFADEKSMNVDDLVRAIEEAVALAARKRLEQDNLEVVFNRNKAVFELFEVLTVDDGDHMGDLTPAEARAIDPDAQLGGTVRRYVEMADLGRIAALSVRQMIHKKGREMELIRLAGSYARRAGQMLIARANSKNDDGWWFELGDLSGLMPPSEFLLTDTIERAKEMRVCIVGVDSSRRTPVVTLSRSRADLLLRLMELEVPEMADGTVEVVAISRDNTGRSKVAVRSRKPQIDPVGACVGVRGSRIQPVVKELNNEKIDIFPYSDDPAKMIASALTPAKN